MTDVPRRQIQWSTVPYSAVDFLDELNGYFWPPQKWDQEQRDNNDRRITRAVANYDDPVRRMAADSLINKAKDRTWPVVNNVIAACEEARRWYLADETRQQLPLGDQPKTPEWSPERVKLAYDLCRTELGRRAAREGWSYRLWTYCRIEMKHPKAAICDEYQRDARAHQPVVEQCHRQAAAFKPKPATISKGFVKLGDVNLDASLAKLGESMLARERKKAAEILGDRR